MTRRWSASWALITCRLAVDLFYTKAWFVLLPAHRFDPGPHSQQLTLLHAYGPALQKDLELTSQKIDLFKSCFTDFLDAAKGPMTAEIHAFCVAVLLPTANLLVSRAERDLALLRIDGQVLLSMAIGDSTGVREGASCSSWDFRSAVCLGFRW